MSATLILIAAVLRAYPIIKNDLGLTAQLISIVNLLPLGILEESSIPYYLQISLTTNIDTPSIIGSIAAIISWSVIGAVLGWLYGEIKKRKHA